MLTGPQLERATQVANSAQCIWTALKDLDEADLIRMLQRTSPFAAKERALLQALIDTRHHLTRP